MRLEDKIILGAAGAVVAIYFLEEGYQKVKTLVGENYDETVKALAAYDALPAQLGGGWFGSRDSFELHALVLYAHLRRGLLGTLGITEKGTQVPAGIVTSPDTPSIPGKYLGNPKNVLGIAGKIRTAENQQIQDGVTISVPEDSDTILIDAALENQSESTRSGKVTARMLTGPFHTPYVLQGPEVELQPGAFQQVALRIPTSAWSDNKGWATGHNYDIALQFASYTLDRVSFHAEQEY